MHWHNLEPEELELCPPLVLLGSDEMLAARGLSQLVWLLNTRLPVKVLVMSSLELGLVEASVNDPRAGIGLLAVRLVRCHCSVTIPGRKAYSARGSASTAIRRATACWSPRTTVEHTRPSTGLSRRNDSPSISSH